MSQESALSTQIQPASQCSPVSTAKEEEEENQEHQWIQYPVRVAADQASLTSTESTLEPDLLQIFDIIKQVPNLFQLLCDSIFSGINANIEIKKALVLSLFYGNTKIIDESVDIFTRDYIHVLLLGSRCSQKNQFLKCITTVLENKASYIVGSSSSLKLIASSNKNFRKGKEPNWCQHAKAALISNEQKFICFDEIEKMDKTQQQVVMQSIEHQCIGVQDANELVLFRPSKVSIIAAANLNTAEYDFGKRIDQNVSISHDLLMKFDLVFLVDNEYDNANRNDAMEYQNEIRRFRSTTATECKTFRKSEMESFLISNSFKSLVTLHQSGQLIGGAKILQNDDDHLLALPILRKYILYCSEYIHPVVGSNVQKALEKFVQQEIHLRSPYKLSLLRTYETLVRLVEAHAKLHMRLNVTEEDLLVVVDIFDKNLPLVKLQTPLIKRSRKSPNLKPKDVYKVLCEAVNFFKKKLFTVEEIVELCLQYIDKSCDTKAIQDSIYTLNEQAMLLKKQNGYEVI